MFNLALMNSSGNKYAILVPLLLFASGLIIRKMGWPFAAAILVIGGIWVTASSMFSGVKIIRANSKVSGTWILPEEILLGTCLALILFQQQYWIYGPQLSWISALLFFCIAGNRVLSMRNKLYLSRIRKAGWAHWLTNSFFALLGFLLFTGLFMNPRTLHNFYRASTYEEFLRSRYPGLSIEAADVLIDRYRDNSEAAKQKAHEYFILARNVDKEKKYEIALKLYNQSIDLDPGNADAYFYRGYLKIHRLELNSDLAFSAVIDFTEAIRLRPDHADSYFQRGATLGYLDKKTRVCEDMHAAFRLDSTLDISFFVKKFCPADSSGTPQFHL